MYWWQNGTAIQINFALLRNLETRDGTISFFSLSLPILKPLVSSNTDTHLILLSLQTTTVIIFLTVQSFIVNIRKYNKIKPNKRKKMSTHFTCKHFQFQKYIYFQISIFAFCYRMWYPIRFLQYAVHNLFCWYWPHVNNGNLISANSYRKKESY